MKKYSYTDDDVKLVEQLYNNNVLIKDIAQKIGVSENTILRLLKRNNIQRNRNIYKLHSNEHSMKIFEDIFIKSVYEPFVPIDDYHNCKLEKYKSNYFDNIDNQDKAYMLGLFYADGNMKQDGYTFSITLQEKDVEILKKINNLIESTHDIYFIKSNNKNWQNCYKLTIYSKRICDALQYHGIIPNKSLKLQFPILPFELYKDFLRGYLDGDGNINKVNNHTITASFVGTENFCKNAQLLIENHLKINCSIMSASVNNNITKTLQIGGKNQVLTFLDWIYKDANLFLPRKYEKYLNINNSLTA